MAAFKRRLRVKPAMTAWGGVVDGKGAVIDGWLHREEIAGQARNDGMGGAVDGKGEVAVDGKAEECESRDSDIISCFLMKNGYKRAF